MNNIGQRIRELRKKNDLTQEKLADLLGVTYQSVSKWECGVTAPDLALIGPLTKLLHITSDELLGLTQTDADERRRELEAACRKAWLDGGGERDGFRMIYDAQETLVREYPGDMNYLCDFAWTTSNRAWNFAGQEERFREEQEKAVRRFETVIEHADSDRLKCSAIEGIIQTLGYLGRHDEAKTYLDLLPDAPYRTKEQLIERLLWGDDLRRHRQRKLENHLRVLLSTMVLCGSNRLQAIEQAEAILHMFFPDGSYTGFHENLYALNHRKAWLLIGEGRYGEAVSALESCQKHAVLADEAEHRGEALPYTSPYFSLLTEEPCAGEPCGNPTHEEAFHMGLADAWYDPLRERADFQELLKR